MDEFGKLGEEGKVEGFFLEPLAPGILLERELHSEPSSKNELLRVPVADPMAQGGPWMVGYRAS